MMCSMKSCSCEHLKKINTMLDPHRKLAGCIASPLFDVGARIYVGWAFLKSGLGRLDSALDGAWADQVFLFTYEHPVPGIPGALAAPLSTGAELVLPVLLMAGLFGRFAAVGLLVMTAVIELTYQHADQHVLWAFLLGMIFIKGPGRFALDHYIVKWIRGE